MDPDYKFAIIEAAITKIEKAGKPISEAELIRGTVHILKKWIGGEKNTHTSKSRFKKEIFNYLVTQNDWCSKIIQLPSKKYDLRIKHPNIIINSNENEWNWQNKDRDIAAAYLKIILEKMDPFKFELLSKKLLEIKYPSYQWSVTSKTGDKGLDINGKRADEKDSSKTELICVQVKRYKGTVGRTEADKFSGALARYAEDKSFSRVEGFFISTGKYPASFHQQLKEASNGKINFLKSWDGENLIDEILRQGMGINFSINISFWQNIGVS